MHIIGNLIRDLPTNRVNGLSAQVWRSCSETGPIIHLGSKVGRGETLKKSVGELVQFRVTPLRYFCFPGIFFKSSIIQDSCILAWFETYLRSIAVRTICCDLN